MIQIFKLDTETANSNSIHTEFNQSILISAANNKMQMKIVKNGVTFSVIILFSFGWENSNGTSEMEIFAYLKWLSVRHHVTAPGEIGRKTFTVHNRAHTHTHAQTHSKHYTYTAPKVIIIHFCFSLFISLSLVCNANIFTIFPLAFSAHRIWII